MGVTIPSAKESTTSPYRPASSYPAHDLKASLSTSSSINTAATPGGDVESLNSIFAGRTSNPNNLVPENHSEDWLPVAMKQIKMYTLIGSIVPIFMSIKAMIELDFLIALFCLSCSVALILCCVYGHQNRDWRFLLGVFIIALLLGAYSVTLFFLTILAMFNNFYLTHTELIKQGYGNIGVMIAFRVLKCLSCVFAFIYWGLVAYANEKLTRILLAETRTNPQQQQQILGIGNECSASTSAERKDGHRPIDRDMTRADFGDLPYSCYPQSPAARGKVIGASPSSYSTGRGGEKAGETGSRKLTFDRAPAASSRPT